MTEKMLESQEILSLSEQLIEARERSGVSVLEMAQKLKLTTVQIEALESENYDKLGPVTFVKGYIRGYCREFDLSESDLMALFFHNEAANQDSMQSFSRRTEREAKDSRLMLFSYFLVALLIGSSVFFVLQDLNKSTNASTLLSSNNGSTAQEISSLKEPQLNAIKIVDIALVDTAKTKLTDDANDASPQTSPVEASLSELDTSTTQGVDTVTKTQLVDVVVMTFKDASWVEIFDTEGERVAFGVKKQGYVMTLEGKGPFNVVLGKHYNVDVVFNDKKVDISYFPKNRLAKFNLPLSE